MKNQKTPLHLAIHPYEERYVDAASQYREFGANPIAASVARCPFCRLHKMEISFASDLAPVFHHRQQVSPIPCPLVVGLKQLDGIYVARVHDNDVHARNRRKFVEDWQTHFLEMRSHASSLSIERYITLISYADVLNLWSYPEIYHPHIPFILLVLADLLVERDENLHSKFVRFAFEGRIRHVTDLWVETVGEPKLFKLEYRRTKLESSASKRSLLACKEVTMRARLATAEEGVSGDARTAFEEFLAAGRESADGQESGSTFGS